MWTIAHIPTHFNSHKIRDCFRFLPPPSAEHRGRSRSPALRSCRGSVETAQAMVAEALGNYPEGFLEEANGAKRAGHSQCKIPGE